MLRTVSRVVTFQVGCLKNFHISALSRLREITVEKKDEKTTVIDCQYVKSPREPYLLKLDKESNKCPLCQLRLNIKHTDVLILSQFIDSKGNIFKFKDTNLCEKQYKLIKELIYMAQYAGLLPEPPRDEPKKPYNLLNTYYDETTICLKRRPGRRDMNFYYLKEKLSPIERLRVRPELGNRYS